MQTPGSADIFCPLKMSKGTSAYGSGGLGAIYICPLSWILASIIGTKRSLASQPLPFLDDSICNRPARESAAESTSQQDTCNLGHQIASTNFMIHSAGYHRPAMDRSEIAGPT